MEMWTLAKPEVIGSLREFVTVSLDISMPPVETITKAQRTKIGEKNQNLEVDLINNISTPCFVAINPNGKVIDSSPGYRDVPAFVAFLNQALAKAKSDVKVAQGGKGL